MTIGVLWEFFEFGMDQFFGKDMQKDTIIQSFQTVLLDPAKGTLPITVDDIRDVIIVKSDGSQTALGLGGYLDIGIIDTMGDLFVNFIGAFVFSILGFFYIKNRGKGKFLRRFIPARINSPENGSCCVPDPDFSSDSPNGRSEKDRGRKDKRRAKSVSETSGNSDGECRRNTITPVKKSGTERGKSSSDENEKTGFETT